MMGAHYADVFDRMDGVAVTACCDPTPWKLDAFAKDRGIPGAYVRFRDMVGSEALDGILNVTPDYLHAEVVRAAVDAGLPILTEKPLVGSLQEAAALESALSGRDLPVVVNFSKRHTAALAALRSVIIGEKLGSLIRVETAYRQGWVFNHDWGDWRTVHAWTWRLDGRTAPLGVLGDLGSHLVDLIPYVTGRQVETVSGGRMAVVPKGIDRVDEHQLDSPDYAVGILGLSGGVPASLTVSRVDADAVDELTVRAWCSAGLAEVNLERDRRRARVKDASGERMVEAEKPPSNYRKFVSILRGEPAEAPGLREGLRAQRILDAVRRSADGGGLPVDVEEADP